MQMTTLYLDDYMPLFERAQECDRISADEENFLEELQERYDEYGAATFLSEKQLNWLKKIAERE